MSTAPIATSTHPKPWRADESKADDGLIDCYLRRLGVEAAPPSPEALAVLHRAHIERVPYETLWLHLRQHWGIDAEESIRHIVAEHRGGYCFHLNGAFAMLLAGLRYTVTRHRAGVHGADGARADTIGNHVALTVHDLPTDANPHGRWYVDLGLGDAIHSPLPLLAGVYRQGPSVFEIGGSDGVGDWSFANDWSGSLSGVSVMAADVGIDVFTSRHEFNATSPDSAFARTVTAQRRDATGADIMRGCVLTRRAESTSAETFERRSDWLDALGDVFGLRLDVPSIAVEALWERVRDTHESWLAAAPADLLAVAS